MARPRANARVPPGRGSRPGGRRNGWGGVREVDDSRVGLILMLLREGNARQAIQAYQEEADVNREVARVRVLQLARQHHTPVRKNLILRLARLALAGLLGLLRRGGLLHGQHD